MNTYQQEQLDALLMVRRHIHGLLDMEVSRLRALMADYLAFRARVAAFLEELFQAVCTETCYRDQRSACCTRDGIIAFFGDVVVNVTVSDPVELDKLESAIRHPEKSTKCIFLSGNGCRWRIKPIVCEMFLCDSAKNRVFEENPTAREQWREYEAERKTFTWPDKPVLFEFLEAGFIASGYRSPLMYMHESPGLRRMRERRGKFESGRGAGKKE